jgi:hypothetical protein
MVVMRAVLLALALLAQSAAVSAQALADTTTQAAIEIRSSATLPAPPLKIPAGTIVSLELVDALSSTTSHVGDLFALRLVEPILIGGREVAPAGALGGGEVIDAAPSGWGGRQGKLILSARYLEIGGQRVRMRSMQMSAAGDDRSVSALTVASVAGAISPVGVFAGMFVTGGEIEIPAGARATARIAADIHVPELSSMTTMTAQPLSAEAPAQAALQSNTNGEEQ